MRYAKNRPQVEAERKRAAHGRTGERAGARVPKVVSAGRKVSNQKREDRDRRRKEIGRRRMLAGVLAVACLGLVIWGLVALSRVPFFTVQTVTVTGVHHLSEAEVLALAAVPSDANVLQLPKAAIASRIGNSPWVSHVDVQGHLPHAVSIAVVERVPIALVDTGAGGVWMISSDGYWIAQRSKEPTGSLIPIRDAPSGSAVTGARVSSPELRNALAVIAGISAQTRGRTKHVSAVSVEKTMLVLKNGVQVIVGSADDIAKKDLIASSILSRQKNVLYVNVRVTDRPTVLPGSPNLVPVN